MKENVIKIEQYQALLSKISQCNTDYLQEKESDYNVFEVLGVKDKEVVMCRFLADLLNPDGTHGYETLFLKTFLSDVLHMHIDNEVLLSHTSVVTEYVIDDARRIDIVISNTNFFLPIEVKIYAEEQESQCYDYYSCAMNYDNNAKVIYLTRFGTKPSVYSRKQKGGGNVLSLDKIVAISWADDIYDWLDRVKEKLNGEVQLLVSQYIDAINRFTDGRKKKIMDKKQKILSESVDFFQAGLEIEKSMKMVKLNLIRSVFDDFKNEMIACEQRYGLKFDEERDYYSYDNPYQEKYYDSNNSTNPGINYVVERAKFKNQNLQLWFRIEVDYQLFAGFIIYDTEAKKNIHYIGYEIENIDTELGEEVASFVDKDIFIPVAQRTSWLTYCYSNGKRKEKCYDDVPDFKTMNMCAINLIDEQKRKIFVKEAVSVFEQELLKHLL